MGDDNGKIWTLILQIYFAIKMNSQDELLFGIPRGMQQKARRKKLQRLRTSRLIPVNYVRST